MGCCAANITINYTKQHRLTWILTSTSLAILLIAALHRYPITKLGENQLFVPHLYLIDPIAGALTAVMLMVLTQRSISTSNTLVVRILEWRPLVSIGTFAYSLYLIHSPLMEVLLQYGLKPLHLGDRTTFGLLAFVGTPLIVGMAYLFFLVFEKPFLTRRRNETAAEIARDAALSPAP
jgi:peptidoglycan/LPS O-acetylase OafA/YrhL